MKLWYKLEGLSLLCLWPVPCLSAVLLFHVTFSMNVEIMILCCRANWIHHLITPNSHPILRHIAINMKYEVPSTWSFSIFWTRLVRTGIRPGPWQQCKQCKQRSSIRRGVRSGALLSCTETWFQKWSQNGKNGSKHPMLSICMAYNVILCKKKSKETLRKIKVAAFTM